MGQVDKSVERATFLISITYFVLYGLVIIGTSIFCAYEVYKQKKQRNELESSDKCYQPFIVWYKLMSEKKKIYLMIVPHLFDTASDIGTILTYYYFYIENPDNINDDINCYNVFIISVVLLSFHRIVSSLAVFNLTRNPVHFILQLFDLMVVKAIHVNYILNTNEPSNPQRYLSILEAVFESAPQILLSIGFMIRTHQFTTILIISSLASLWSLVSRITLDDKSTMKQNYRSIDFSFKSLKHCKCKRIINCNYITRILWRLIEISSRIFILLLLWITFHGSVVFIIILVECLYLLFLVFRSKSIDALSNLVYLNISMPDAILYLTVLFIYFRLISNVIYMICITIFVYINHTDDILNYALGYVIFIASWILSMILPLFIHHISNNGIKLSNNTRNLKELTSSDKAADLAELLVFGTAEKSLQQNARRYKEGEYDIDLTFITDSVVVLGFPSKQIVDFFEKKFQHYKIFCFIDESALRHIKMTDEFKDNLVMNDSIAKIEQNTYECPAFDNLISIIGAIEVYLGEHANDKAMVAMLGFGEVTGLFICCYQLQAGMWETAIETIRFYGVSRTKNQKGITIPSLRRYVGYYEKYMRNLRNESKIMESVIFTIDNIFVSTKNPPTFNKCIIRNKNGTYTIDNIRRVKSYDDRGIGFELWPTDMQLTKDTKIEFIHRLLHLRDQLVFCLTFNADWEEVKENDRIILRFEKEEIDKVNMDATQRNFEVVISIKILNEEIDKNDDTLKVSEMSMEQFAIQSLRLQTDLVVRNRGWKGVIYEDCFTGSDVYKLFRNDCMDDAEITKFGELLFEREVICDVKREGKSLNELKNGPFFYRFYDRLNFVSNVINEMVISGFVRNYQLYHIPQKITDLILTFYQSNNASDT